MAALLIIAAVMVVICDWALCAATREDETARCPDLFKEDE